MNIRISFRLRSGQAQKAWSVSREKLNIKVLIAKLQIKIQKAIGVRCTPYELDFCSPLSLRDKLRGNDPFRV
jgi:hypothetical protein